jgi:catechol 2,3-dioxygenase-like lactoylglutathione lyase family enzyme
LDFTDQSGHGGVDVALGEDRVDVAVSEDRADVGAGNDRVDIAAGNDRVDVAGVDYLSIFTPELRRSVDFYSRVFGFCVVDASRRPDGRSVLMGAGRFCLALHERQRTESDSTRTLSWSFIVDDLDRARAIVWNLGIVPLRRGAQEPQRNTPWRRSRSFMIRDPNGNEIEVVQQPR